VERSVPHLGGAELAARQRVRVEHHTHDLDPDLVHLEGLHTGAPGVQAKPRVATRVEVWHEVGP